MAVAVKGGVVGAANRDPAPAAVVVGVVPVAVAAGVGAAVAVGVKVQVGAQFIPCAGRLLGGGGTAVVVGQRAAHPGHGVGEGVSVLFPVGPGGIVLVAAAVQVIADGVQLGQGGDFKQPVIVVVIVGAGAALAL